jgi:hypothetical protein
MDDVIGFSSTFQRFAASEFSGTAGSMAVAEVTIMLGSAARGLPVVIVRLNWEVEDRHNSTCPRVYPASYSRGQVASQCRSDYGRL